MNQKICTNQEPCSKEPFPIDNNYPQKPIQSDKISATDEKEKKELTSPYKLESGSKSRKKTIEDYLHIKNNGNSNQVLETVKKLKLEFENYCSQLKKQPQKESTNSQSREFTKVSPEGLLASITIHPVGSYRCNLVARNLLKQVLFFCQNMLTTKIEKKIGKFIDKYPLCFIFVRDYGVKSKEEFPALCTLAVKSRLIFTGSISEILVEQLINDMNEGNEFYPMRQKRRSDLSECDSPQYNTKLPIIPHFESTVSAASFENKQAKQKSQLQINGAGFKMTFMFDKKVFRLVSKTIDASQAEIAQYERFWESMETEQNQFLMEWRGDRREPQRQLMFDMLGLAYWRQRRGPISRCTEYFLGLINQKSSEEQNKLNRYDNMSEDHFPYLSETCKKCLYCSSKQAAHEKSKLSKYICEGCTARARAEIHLCLSCFIPYHEDLYRQDPVENPRKKRRSLGRRRSRISSLNKNRRNLSLPRNPLELEEGYQNQAEQLGSRNQAEQQPQEVSVLSKEELIMELHVSTEILFARIQILISEGRIEEAEKASNMVLALARKLKRKKKA